MVATAFIAAHQPLNRIRQVALVVCLSIRHMYTTLVCLPKRHPHRFSRFAGIKRACVQHRLQVQTLATIREDMRSNRLFA